MITSLFIVISTITVLVTLVGWPDRLFDRWWDAATEEQKKAHEIRLLRLLLILPAAFCIATICLGSYGRHLQAVYTFLAAVATLPHFFIRWSKIKSGDQWELSRSRKDRIKRRLFWLCIGAALIALIALPGGPF